MLVTQAFIYTRSSGFICLTTNSNFRCGWWNSGDFCTVAITSRLFFVYTRGPHYFVFSCIICYFSSDAETTPSSAISIPIPTSIVVYRIRTYLLLMPLPVLPPLLSYQYLGSCLFASGERLRVLWKLTAMRMMKGTPVNLSMAFNLYGTHNDISIESESRTLFVSLLAVGTSTFIVPVASSGPTPSSMSGSGYEN